MEVRIESDVRFPNDRPFVHIVRRGRMDYHAILNDGRRFVAETHYLTLAGAIRGGTRYLRRYVLRQAVAGGGIVVTVRRA